MRSIVALIPALVLCAGGARAQFDHRLVVRASTGAECGKTTEALDDDALDVACEFGVVGVDPNSYSNRAAVNSATGELSVSSLLSVEGFPLPFDPGNIDTIATIQERIFRTQPGPLRATLQVAPGLSASGYTVDYEATLWLTNTCTALISQTAGNGFVDPPSTTANCLDGSASVDGNTLSVTLEGSATTIDLLAQLRAEWLFGSLPSQYQIEATLRVQGLEGAAFSAASPSFLTQTPEADAAGTASAVLALLGWHARKRS